MRKNLNLKYIQVNWVPGKTVVWNNRTGKKFVYCGINPGLTRNILIATESGQLIPKHVDDLKKDYSEDKPQEIKYTWKFTTRYLARGESRVTACPITEKHAKELIRLGIWSRAFKIDKNLEGWDYDL